MNGVLGFDYPWALTGFAFFIFLFLHDIFSGRKKRVRTFLPPPLLRRLFVSKVFFRAFLAFFIIALSGPRWGHSPWGHEEASGEYRRSLDAVIAVDVSRSMEIRDAADGSGGELKRLERGLAIVRDALAVVPPERCAAVVSRSRGMLAVPLTWDDTVINFLEALDGSSLTGRGTNLESLVDAAAGAFANTSSARKTIILVSDGEALSGNLKTALDRCIREGIMVCAVAAGSDEGRPVPGLDTVSRRDASAMRTAAEKTEGIYIDGNSKDAAAILAGFLRSKSGDTGGRTKREQKQRWLLFAVLAIISFGASKLCLLQFKKRDDK